MTPDCIGNIQAGETKKCVITNDDVGQSTLIVKKHVVNDNGGTKEAKDFTIDIGGASSGQPSPNNFQGSESGTTVSLNARSFYSVTESVDPLYTLTQSPDCSGEMGPGEVRTCVLTNDDVALGTLIVKKHVINDNGGSKQAKISIFL